MSALIALRGVVRIARAASGGVSGNAPRIARAEQAIAAVADLVEKASLVTGLASLEWQEPDGSRKGAVNSGGERLYFVSPELIAELRAAITKITGEPK